MYKIDLIKYFDKKYSALVGRDNGEDLLKRLKEDAVILMELEKSHNTICIIIPKYIVTMNKSFFLGFLETRVQILGKDKFLEIYKFEGNQHIYKLIKDKYIDAALGRSSVQDFLNA